MKIDEPSVLVRETIAHNVKTLREGAGMSQETLAQMVSMNRSYVSEVEGGKRNVSVDILVKIADGFDIPITDLFKGADEVPPRKLSELYSTRYRSISF